MSIEERDIEGDWFSQFPLGQEEPGHRNWIDDNERQLGGKESSVEYYFNDWRYRGTIRPGAGVNASFGCSHTLGYGVQQPFSEIIKYANLGVNGISNDAIARLAYTYCEQFNPSSIVVVWTMPSRREHVNADGRIVKFKMENLASLSEDNFAYASLQNDKLDEYNLIKNKLFLKNYCKMKNIKLLDYDFKDNDHEARDKLHPGPVWHANMAAGILYDQ